MYRKEKPLAMKTSASASFNNFSVYVDRNRSHIYYAVIHKHTVNIITTSVDGSSVNHRAVVCREPSVNQTSSALQARFIPFGARIFLVVTSALGIQVFDAETALVLYWYAFGDGRTETFGRGICGIGDDTMCIGTFDGYILVFDVPKKSSNITLSQNIKKHSDAICDLESEGKRLASADNDGTIIIWKADGENYEHTVVVPGKGYPCTSVKLWKDFVIGGYGSGHIRVFNVISGDVCAEVNAHARWINALDVAKSAGLLLSVSDDTFARVWKLSTTGSMPISLVHSECAADQQLQGGQFINADGSAFGCTGYDYFDIQFYRKDER